jgi:hypothetical protein
MDNSGKTTLARELANELPGLYLNMRARPKSDRDIWSYVAHVSPLPFPTVFDRHPLFSDPIYGSILRSGSLVTEQVEVFLYRLITELSPRKPAVIYCRPPDHSILNTLGDRPQMEGVEKRAGRLLDEYDFKSRLWAKHFPLMVYDYTIHSLNEVIRYLTLIQGPVDVNRPSE